MSLTSYTRLVCCPVTRRNSVSSKPRPGVLRPPSLASAGNLPEPRITADVAPPPVVRPGEPDAVRRVRRHLLLEQPERRVAIAQKQISERLERKEFTLRIHVRTTLRPREHPARAVGEPGARDHRRDPDLGLQPAEAPQLRRRELPERFKQRPGDHYIGLFRFRGHEPELTVDEPGVLREAALPLLAPANGVGELLEVIRRGEELVEDLVGYAEVRVRLIGALSIDLRLHVIRLLIAEVAERAPRASPFRREPHRLPKICFGVGQELGGSSRCGSEAQEILPVPQLTAQLEI